MRKRLRVGILFGGRSSEHEVSLLSAEEVVKHLDEQKYEIVPIGITREGFWISSGMETFQLLRARQPLVSNAVLLPEPARRGIVSLRAGSRTRLIPIDIFFPVLHGAYGEDGAIQGLLELADIPYVGCGILSSAVGMDKVIQKQLFSQQRIPIVPYLFFYQATWDIAREQTLERIENLFAYPLFVKPARLGSSVGVSRAKNRRALLAAVQDAFRYDGKILVEEGIAEPREFECAVGAREHVPVASSVGEIIVARAFYDYAAKYLDRRTTREIPAKIEASLSEQIQRLSLEAFHAIDGCGMSRVDFLYNPRSQELYLNEINTIPGFTQSSSFPKLWEASGIPLSSFFDSLISEALASHRRGRKILKSFHSTEHFNTKVLASS